MYMSILHVYIYTCKHILVLHPTLTQKPNISSESSKSIPEPNDFGNGPKTVRLQQPHLDPILTHTRMSLFTGRSTPGQ
jgi:hypothetical protein